MAPDQAQRKRKLAQAFRIIAHRGLDDGVAGHISVRDPDDDDRFWINPLGALFAEITADHLLQVDGQGRVQQGQGRYNKAGFVIHHAIHSARPDVHAVVHTHPPAGTAFSALDRRLRIVDQTASSFFDDIAVYPQYTGVVLDKSAGLSIASALGKMRAIILRNHGLITCAATVEQAVVDMIDLERTCELNLRLLPAPQIVEVESEAARETQKIFTSPERIRLVWDALVRQLPGGQI